MSGKWLLYFLLLPLFYSILDISAYLMTNYYRHYGRYPSLTRSRGIYLHFLNFMLIGKSVANQSLLRSLTHASALRGS